MGKTTALYQLVEALLSQGTMPGDILLVRFDLPALVEHGGLPLVRWHAESQHRSGRSTPTILLLDEVHKLSGWSEQIKHLYDTFPVRMVVTGSSIVLVARGQRESLAGRATTVDFPPFLFREVLESWHPDAVEALPAPISFAKCFDGGFRAESHFHGIHSQPPQRLHSWRRRLDRYFNRGGYPTCTPAKSTTTTGQTTLSRPCSNVCSASTSRTCFRSTSRDSFVASISRSLAPPAMNCRKAV